MLIFAGLCREHLPLSAEVLSKLHNSHSLSGQSEGQGGLWLLCEGMLGLSSANWLIRTQAALRHKAGLRAACRSRTCLYSLLFSLSLPCSLVAYLSSLKSSLLHLSLLLFLSGVRGKSSAVGCNWGICWWLLFRGSHAILCSWRT